MVRYPFMITDSSKNENALQRAVPEQKQCDGHIVGKVEEGGGTRGRKSRNGRDALMSRRETGG